MIKLLIIGCGSIGQRHIKNAITCCIVGIIDLDPTKVDRLRDEVGNVTIFDDFQKALAWKPQAILIATPPETHITLALSVIEHCDYLLIEKPISHSMANVHRLQEMAKANHVQVAVVSNMRFHPAIKLLKENLIKIGVPLFARAYFGNYLPNMRPGVDYRSLYVAKKQSGGIILDCIHEIDYLQWFFGEASIESLVQANLSELDIEGCDYASLNLSHVTRVRSELHFDYLQVIKRRGCELVGDKGILIWESTGKSPESCKVRLYDSFTMKWSMIYEELDIDINHPYIEMMKEFISAVSNDINLEETAISTLSDGVSALSTCLKTRTNKHNFRESFNEI